MKILDAIAPFKIYIAIAAFIAVGGFVWWVRSLVEDSHQLDVVRTQVKSLQQEALRNDQITARLEHDLAINRASAAKTRAALDAELRGAAYRVAVPADGLRILQNAARNPSQPDSAVR